MAWRIPGSLWHPARGCGFFTPSGSHKLRALGGWHHSVSFAAQSNRPVPAFAQTQCTEARMSDEKKLKMSGKYGTDEAEDVYGKTIILVSRLAFSPLACAVALSTAVILGLPTGALVLLITPLGQ